MWDAEGYRGSTVDEGMCGVVRTLGAASIYFVIKNSGIICLVSTVALSALDRQLQRLVLVGARVVKLLPSLCFCLSLIRL